MARRFRVYHKKRGNRRTGSEKLGHLGETVFFAAFFLIGCAGLALMCATLVIPQWKARHDFVAHHCRVLDARLGQKQSGDVTLYRPEIQIEYEIDGETYRTWTYDVRGEYSPDKPEVEKILDRFQPHPQREYDCWYDPSDANVAVLARAWNWWAWLTLIVPLSFILIGGGGLAYQLLALGRSTERRAELVRRAGKLELFEAGPRSKNEFPNVPPATNITNSPGTKLAFRLPAAGSSTWALTVTLLACVAWNGIVAFFAVACVRSHLKGEPDWFLTLFIFPFIVIGIGLMVFLFRQLLLTTGIGPTLVEVSDQPLYPGGRYRLFLTQTGRLKLNALEVLLVCDEEATFCHGTNTRKETRRVCQSQVLARRSFEMTRAAPFEADCELHIPAGAMHSFRSDHNEVTWKVLVRGEAAGWPGYERIFPLIVHPGQNGNHGA